jgi:hypothetical protein
MAMCCPAVPAEGWNCFKQKGSMRIGTEEAEEDDMARRKTKGTKREGETRESMKQQRQSKRRNKKGRQHKVECESH